MLKKKRILLTMPIPLLEDADSVAAALNLSRGEFVRHAILKSLADFRDGGGKLSAPSRLKKWSIFSKWGDRAPSEPCELSITNVMRPLRRYSGGGLRLVSYLLMGSCCSNLTAFDIADRSYGCGAERFVIVVTLLNSEDWSFYRCVWGRDCTAARCLRKVWCQRIQPFRKSSAVSRSATRPLTPSNGRQWTIHWQLKRT